MRLGGRVTCRCPGGWVTRRRRVRRRARTRRQVRTCRRLRHILTRTDRLRYNRPRYMEMRRRRGGRARTTIIIRGRVWTTISGRVSIILTRPSPASTSPPTGSRPRSRSPTFAPRSRSPTSAPHRLRHTIIRTLRHTARSDTPRHSTRSHTLQHLRLQHLRRSGNPPRAATNGSPPKPGATRSSSRGPGCGSGR